MAKLSTILGSAFDSSAVTPKESRDFSALPAGMYTAEVTNSEVKDLKSGNGIGLNLEFTIIDPEQFAKRKVWQSINIKHSNGDAERIGQSELSALCRAVGIHGVLDDTDMLFGRMVRIRTRVRRQEGYEPKAEVTGYEPMGTGTAPTTSRAPAPAAGKAAAPWARKAAA